MDEDYPPLFMYREKPEFKVDSGWRIFSGFESDEYLEDAENFSLYNYSTLCRRYKSVLNLLLSGIGSAYERESVESEWYRVDDFRMEDDYDRQIRIDEHWTILLNNLFQEEVEDDGTLYFTTGDKSVRLKSWQVEDSKERISKDLDGFINSINNKEQKILQEYRLPNDRGIVIGYRVNDQNDFKEYEVIYGQNIMDNHVLQIALYFDNMEDEKWAIETWKTIKFEGK